MKVFLILDEKKFSFKIFENFFVVLAFKHICMHSVKLICFWFLFCVVVV